MRPSGRSKAIGPGRGLLVAVLLLTASCQRPSADDGTATPTARSGRPLQAAWSRDQLQVREAALKARNMSPEDSRDFVVAFRAALSREPFGSRQFDDDPRYVANAKSLIESALDEDVQMYVIGGSATNEFPECVAVGTSDDWCCSGTLIGRNVVLTAGHCLDECGRPTRVFFGPDVRDADLGIEVPVASCHRHPEYEGDDVYRHDIMVLILSQDVDAIAPASLAHAERIHASASVRVVGYGYSDRWRLRPKGRKRQVDIPIASPACNEPEDPETYGCHRPDELVAADPLHEKDSCWGDSGGPAFVAGEAIWELAGVTSRAVKDAQRPCGDGGTYVRADRYEGWIRSVPGARW